MMFTTCANGRFGFETYNTTDCTQLLMKIEAPMDHCKLNDNQFDDDYTTYTTNVYESQSCL